MIEKIYIARHGFRLNWITSTWQSVTGLPRDPPLAAYGETQARELATYFISLPENERPTAIFSSPYYRCLQTAQPTAQALGLPIFVEHGIAEWYSPVAPGTGLHPRPAPASELKRFFPEIDPSWTSLWLTPRTGEDVAQVHERSEGFLNAFMHETVRRLPEGPGGGQEASNPTPTHKRVLLVSHAATVITLARSLTREPELPLRVGCCSLSVFIPNKDSARTWVPLLLADGTHLKGGPEREWGFEDIEVEHGRVIEDPGVPGTENEVDTTAGAQVQICSNL